jgi:hypothetical protein
MMHDPITPRASLRGAFAVLSEGLRTKDGPFVLAFLALVFLAAVFA